MLFRPLCLLLGSAITAAAASLAPIPLVRGPQNHLLVAATVNGQPATFLLDTGSDASFVQQSGAQRLRLRVGGPEVDSGGRGFPRGTIENLRTGNVSLGQVAVALYDPAQFRGPVPGRGGKPADGLIGLDLLRRLKAVINCRTQQLFLQSGAGQQMDLAQTTRALGFTRVPLQESARGYLSVPCEVVGQPGALMLDTGAFITVFNEADLRALQLEQTPSKLTARTPFGRVRAMQLARIDNLRIGGVRIEPQRFAVMNVFPTKKPFRPFMTVTGLDQYAVQALKARYDVIGLLGNELLYEHHAIIDLDSMSLFLR